MLMLLLTGCGLDALPAESDLDRLRILGVIAEPAEPAPGDAVTFTALTHTPQGDIGLVWQLCGIPLDCPGAALTDNPDGLLDGEEPAEGTTIIGLQPGLDPAMVIPPGLLDGVESAEGVELTLGLVGVALSDADEADEWATKALPVSEMDAPNDNPTLDAITLDEVAHEDGAVVTLDADSVALDVLLGEDAEQTYTYRNSAGEDEVRTEEVTTRYYSNLGEISGRTWLLNESGEGVLIAVSRDGRGGTAWLTLSVTVP